ncbi:MAG: NAD(P)H-hydrate dehydratase [Bacteroidetes bacterium]|nr:MAG: NAD(P)H-hydrate dehydratase [Bacteroidota bacterium]TAG90237.1 MAG: NAD(P)H-hydrate dehydratase [Bacteroidota bacterium]
MKILTGEQTRAWDKFTIENEPIESFDLMLRASKYWMHKLRFQYLSYREQNIYILAGLGNNGGDALCIAKMLAERNYKVYVWVIWHGEKFTEETAKARYILETSTDIDIFDVTHTTQIPNIPADALIIDGIFGTGLTRPVTGWVADFFCKINKLSNQVFAIDMPSGLLSDKISEGNAVICATETLTLEAPKLAFLLPENEKYVGNWKVIDVYLHPDFLFINEFQYELITKDLVKKFIKKRPKFAHKGTFGHALLIGGEYGKAGAILLAGKACLKSGAGLLTIFAPCSAHTILQTALPDAIFLADENEKYITKDIQNTEKYQAIGIGCGLGTNPDTKTWLENFLIQNKNPLVLDADALNLIAEMGEKGLSLIPQNSILTPHPKEFDRLVGASEDSLERLEKLKILAQKIKSIVLLKGHHTAIATPEGRVYFNNTGNSAMAKGGSGDVLTGIITSLLAQGYTSWEASILGVYWHGHAGDNAKSSMSEVSVLASDLIKFLGKSWRELQINDDVLPF